MISESDIDPGTAEIAQIASELTQKINSLSLELLRGVRDEVCDLVHVDEQLPAAVRSSSVIAEEVVALTNRVSHQALRSPCTAETSSSKITWSLSTASRLVFQYTL